MAWKERLVAVALSLERLQFAGDIYLAVGVVAYVKWNHAYGVAGDEVLVALGIVECESEYAVEVFEKVDALVAI